MKKLFLVIAFCCFIVGLKANPMPSPTISLSEIAFDENGWVVELRLFFGMESYPIESVWIKTTSGISKVKQIHLTLENDIIVIRKDSMESNLDINPLGDSIQILFGNDDRFLFNSEYLIFGNMPNAQSRSPKSGESLAFFDSAHYNNYFSIDKSPTFGLANTTEGMFGTLTGKIYDKDGQLYTSDNLYNSLTGLTMNIKSDGTYSTSVFSSNHPLFELCSKENNSDYFYIHIAPLTVVMDPDSIVLVDIHIRDSIKADIKNVKQKALSLMKISPNPIKDGQLNYEITLPVQSSDCSIEFINLTGQKTASFKIAESQGTLSLPSSMQDGVYSTSLIVNGKRCFTTKIVIARK